MEFKTGDVVMLKSGGQALTVASVDKAEVECVWLGEEGDLFRETLPAAVLIAAQYAEDDEEEDAEKDEDAVADEESDDLHSAERNIA